MTEPLDGVVENGTIIVDPGAEMPPDGTPVQVQPLDWEAQAERHQDPADLLQAELIEAAEGPLLSPSHAFRQRLRQVAPGTWTISQPEDLRAFPDAEEIQVAATWVPHPEGPQPAMVVLRVRSRRRGYGLRTTWLSKPLD